MFICVIYAANQIGDASETLGIAVHAACVFGHLFYVHACFVYGSRCRYVGRCEVFIEWRDVLLNEPSVIICFFMSSLTFMLYLLP